MVDYLIKDCDANKTVFDLFYMLLMKFRLSYADVMQQGWIIDPASRMLTVKKQQTVTEQKLDSSKLQRLTEYVFHLEH